MDTKVEYPSGVYWTWNQKYDDEGNIANNKCERSLGTRLIGTNLSLWWKTIKWKEAFRRIILQDNNCKI